MAQEARGISCDTELWARVSAWAKKEGRSLSNAVERLLTIQMDQIDKEGK
jgi:hypothetical protein